MIDPTAAKMNALEERAVRSLAGFVRLMWAEVEPARKFRWSWHHQLIAEELEAVDTREAAPAKSADLVINVPPGHGKSMLISVFWPTWRWLRSGVEPHRGGSGAAVISASHGESLAMRDSRRGRDLTNAARFLRLAARAAVSAGEATWATGRDAQIAAKHSTAAGHRDTFGVPPGCDTFRPWEVNGGWRGRGGHLLVCAKGTDAGRLWWPSQQVTHDQSGRANFRLPGGGGRLAVGVRGGIMGRRADLAVIDDPLDALRILKLGAARANEIVEESNDWYDGVLSTRMNPGAPRVLVMQRLHENDMAGRMIERGARHVVLPGLWEEDHPHAHARDPRAGGPEGVALWPGVIPAEKLIALADVLGQWGSSGQIAQRPSPKGGGQFKAAWFARRYHLDSRDLASALMRVHGVIAITVDTSGGSKKPGASNTSMQAWGLAPGAWGGHGGIWPRVDLKCQPSDRYLLDDVSGKWEFTDLEREFRALVGIWPGASLIIIENKALGAALIQVCKDLHIIAANPTTDKATRAGYTERAAEASKIILPSPAAAAMSHPERPEWAEDWLAEHLKFGAGGAKNDRVDASSQLHHHWLSDEVDPLGSLDYMSDLLDDIELHGF